MASTITVNVVADVNKLRSGLGTANSELSKFGNASTKAGNFLGKSMKVAGIAAAGTGIAVVKFAGDSIRAATDLNETISKTKTIFGAASPDIMKFGDNAATSLGLSKQSALDGLSTFGNFFNQIGVGTKKSADLSKSFVQMSSDLASFNNANPADVMEAFSAATRGEYDSLQKYIPTINAAKVQQEALIETGKKSVKDLTDQDKALALHTLAFKGQGKAQGDFARTSGGLANQQRILSAEFENVKGKIGTALLPIMLQLAKTVQKDLLPMLQDFADWFSKNGPKAIDGLVSAFKTVLPVITTIGKFFADHAKTIGILIGAFYAITAAVAAYNVVMSAYAIISKVVAAATIVWRNAQLALNIAMMLNPIGVIIIAIVALVAIFVLAWKNSETFRNIIIGTWNAIKTAAVAVWGFIKGVIEAVINWIKGAATATINGFKGVVTAAWNAIKSATSAVWNAIKSAISTVIGWIKTAITTYFNAYKTIVLAVWNAIRSSTTTVWNAVKTVVSNVINGIKTVVTNVLNTVKSFITGVWNSVKTSTQTIWNGIKTAVTNGVTNVVNAVRGIKDKILNFFKGAAGWLIEAGKDVIRGLIGGIGDMASAVADKAKSVVGGAISAAKGALGIKSPSKVFAEIGKFTTLGLAKGLGDRGAIKKVKTASGRMLGAIQTDVGFTASMDRSLAVGSGGTGNGNNTYNITVEVPVGANPAQVGQSVVETIKAYETVNGTRWRQ